MQHQYVSKMFALADLDDLCLLQVELSWWLKAAETSGLKKMSRWHQSTFITHVYIPGI